MKKIICYLVAVLLLQSVISSAVASTPLNAYKRRLKVGLVLGGGGAKGAAHTGVLQAIEKSGIPIDFISGTSIGSIVGGLYACGYHATDIEKLFRSQQWKSLLYDREMDYKSKPLKKVGGITYFFGYPVGKKNKDEVGDRGFGASRGDKVVELIDSITNLHDSINFDALPIPFRCVAVDMKTMSEVVISSGKLSTAMRASMAIPGAFKPVKMGDSTLVDGGVLNNLPVDVCRAMGADVIIAIDLTQNKHERVKREIKARKTLTGRVYQWLRARPDIVKYNENRANCDIYINPDLKGFEATSFVPGKIDTMIQRGIEAGEAALSELKKLKKKVMKGK